MRSLSVMLPNVPSVSSLSQADPKSDIPTEVVPANMRSKTQRLVLISGTKSSTPVPTPLAKPILVKKVLNYEKLENTHAD